MFINEGGNPFEKVPNSLVFRDREEPRSFDYRHQNYLDVKPVEP
jgi:hypothetical protein